MKNFTINLSSKIGVAVVVFASACGSNKTVQQNVATEGPAGRVFSDKLNFYDGAPSVSADGTKIVFESGRSGSSIRVYRLTLPSDPSSGTPSTAERVTKTDDLMSETVPKISADGSFVTFLANDASGVRNLYKSDWSGSNLGKFSVSNDQVFSHGISSDGAFLAYAAHDSETDSVKVVLVDATNSATTATLNSGSRNITGFTWLEASGGNYKIATVSTVDDSGISQIQIDTWAFTGVADFAGSTASIMTTKSVVTAADNLGNWLTQSGSSFITVQQRAPSNDRSVSELGAGAIADRRIFARSDLLLINSSGVESTSDEALGQSLTGVTASDNIVSLQTNETSRCVADQNSTQIISFKISATPATASSYERLIVRKTSTQLTYDLVSDPCDTSLSAEGVALDTAPGESALSANATTTNMTLAYVSIVTGDPEIVVIRRNSGNTRVWNVSANPVTE